MIRVGRRVGKRARGALACGFAAGLLACNLLTGAADLDVGDAPVGEGGALDGSPGDAAQSTDSPTTPDADASVPDAAPRCDRKKPFGPPAVVPGLGTPAEEFGVGLTPDERTAYFASNRVLGSGFDLYVATRSGADAPFGPAKRIDELATANDDRHPSISADGTTLVFIRMLPVTANDVFLTTKGSTGAFANATPLSFNSPVEDADPFLLPGGKTIYFSSPGRGPGGAGARIYVSQQDLSGAWSTPVVARGLENVTAGDATPTDDELEMFVKMGTQIHYTSRKTKTEDFAPPVPVPELAGATSDQPDWVSPDGCRLYLTSPRDGGAGGNDIWFAQRGK